MPSNRKKNKPSTSSVRRVAAPKGTRQGTNRDVPVGKTGKTSQGRFKGLPGGGSEGRAPLPKMKKVKSSKRYNPKKRKATGGKMGRKTKR